MFKRRTKSRVQRLSPAEEARAKAKLELPEVVAKEELEIQMLKDPRLRKDIEKEFERMENEIMRMAMVKDAMKDQREADKLPDISPIRLPKIDRFAKEYKLSQDEAVNLAASALKWVKAAEEYKLKPKKKKNWWQRH